MFLLIKKLLFCSTLIFALANNCYAAVPDSIKKSFRQIVELIKADRAAQLSTLVDYPLARENPLPDISTAAEFVSYYNTLFDSAFKASLKFYDDGEILERNGSYGLVGAHFRGEIWLDEDGMIKTINYSSKKEQQLKMELTEKAKREIHPSLNNWINNVLVARSAKLLIRIDKTDKGLRYAAWSKGRQMNEQPDLVLYNGVEERQGTMGGWTYTFTNKGWTYTVDEVDMCGDEQDCGLFLELLFNDELKSKIKLKEIK